MPCIVLDPVAVADFLNHFEVEHRPLVQPVCLEDLPFRFELLAIPRQLGLDRLDRLLGPVAGRDEVCFGIDRHLVVPPEGLARQRVERDELVHFVAKELDPQRLVFV